MLKRLAKHHLKMDHKHDIVDEVGMTENHVPILGEAIEVHAEDHLDKTRQAFLGVTSWCLTIWRLCCAKPCLCKDKGHSGHDPLSGWKVVFQAFADLDKRCTRELQVQLRDVAPRFLPSVFSHRNQ